jgi:hypothetical protein
MTNQFPIGSGVNPAADANWQNMIDVQKHSFLPGAPDLTSLYQPGNFGTPPPSPTLRGAEQTAHQYQMETQQPARSIVEDLFPASARPYGEGYDAGGIVQGGFDPTSGDPFRLGSPVSMQASYDDAMLGAGGNAINFYEDLMAMGQGVAAEDFRIAYREENGVDPAAMSVVVGAQGDGGPRQSDYYDQLDPGTQVVYDKFAALHPDQDTASLTKDFQALNTFLDTLPSEEQRAEQDKADVTQADVDAYLKELDAMSDEDYNQIAKNLGLSSELYKGTDAGADKSKFGMEGDTGSGLGFRGTKMEGGPDAETVFKEDMDRIVKEVAAAKSTCLLGGGTWGVNGCEPGEEKEEALECGEGRHEENGACVADTPGLTCGEGYHEENGACVLNVTDIGPEIEDIFGGLVSPHQEGEIRRRMAELGTTDLTQTIRDEFATITTPDYAADILTARESMRTAVRDAATARSEQLEAATTRAEGRIAEIKSTLTGELAAFEIGRVEQQTALNQKVIDRTTDMELALTERLADIRAELGDQVTDEFESVAALAGTMVSSQATSSQDAMSRLGQVANMAAAARLAAPVELSAEALTALSDLEFQIENEISRSKTETIAQINIEEASALLQEIMRQGGFETNKQQALVEATLTEKLRGTVYEDRVQEMMTEALLQEDQYVRQFTEGVDRAEAQAKLQNLFGTQDYQRQLDMMNLTRTWQTADTLQGREWQTADVSQARGWQTADVSQARGWQTSDLALARQQQLADQETGREWQQSDYVTALGDQRADELRRRGWQTQDIDEANLWQLAMATQDRDWELADALAAGAVGDNPLAQLKNTYPDQDAGLYAAAMQIARLSDKRESASSWQKDDPRGDPDFEGLVEESVQTINGKEVVRYWVTEYGGQSEAEAYLRSLGEGAILTPADRGRQAVRTPALSAEDYAALRALSDIARVLVEREDDALQREWVTRMQQGGTTDIYGGVSAGTSGTNRFAGSPYTSTGG